MPSQEGFLTKSLLQKYDPNVNLDGMLSVF